METIQMTAVENASSGTRGSKTQFTNFATVSQSGRGAADASSGGQDVADIPNADNRNDELNQTKSRAAALLQQKRKAIKGDATTGAGCPAGNEDAVESPQPAAVIASASVTYQALPPRSKARLVTLLNEWACWHQDYVAEVDASNRLLLPIARQIEAAQPAISGRLQFIPARACQGKTAAAAWTDTPDRPAPPFATQTRQPASSFNVAYEQMGDEVPTYQRSAFHALGNLKQEGISLWPWHRAMLETSQSSFNRRRKETSGKAQVGQHQIQHRQNKVF